MLGSMLLQDHLNAYPVLMASFPMPALDNAQPVLSEGIPSLALGLALPALLGGTPTRKAQASAHCVKQDRFQVMVP